MNKKKIFNDPIYGFINIPSNLIFDIIEHPYFQRLRRIKQLGLTDLVYPGALHTRFHHALGAMHLMGLALTNLRNKGHEVSEEEMEAGQIAILLHDIGHGPFSHALETTLLSDSSHEAISLFIISELNEQFGGALQLTIEMFQDTYHRKFFHQLISSQLDIDRLDYLQRDSYFTGVSEGTIGAHRIIKMLQIVDDELVVEEKGVYSIENFLTARRLMYWQVYLHKATVSAETMMVQIIRRAQELARKEENIFASAPLKMFLEEEVTYMNFISDKIYLNAYSQLDDYDIWGAMKVWVNYNDSILSYLCRCLLTRKLFRVEIFNEIPDKDYLRKISDKVMTEFEIDKNELNYYFIKGILSNEAYVSKSDKINILSKNGTIQDVAIASDLPNIKALGKIVKKHYICWPKSVYL